MIGRELAALVNGPKETGEYSVEWNAEGVPSGVYIYRLTVGAYTETKKMVLVR